VAGPFLVHGPGRDLLRGVLVTASLLEALLDVFVLTLSLVAPAAAVASRFLPSGADSVSPPLPTDASQCASTSGVLSPATSGREQVGLLRQGPVQRVSLGSSACSTCRPSRGPVPMPTC
jgi:hypothetical protein